MYYIRKIFVGPFGAFLASFFAILCAANSLLTGNIVQINSATSAVPAPPIVIGAIMGIIAAWISLGGGKRISAATVMIIPFLSVIYIIICLAIIFNNIDKIGQITKEIMESAFSLRSASGGIGGFAIMRAMRFGVTRGIFSNEAGCGTSPTAHAQAETKSPHHQGCFGIFEVFADTMVLCTMTGFVILLCGECNLDGIPLTLYAFRVLAGAWAEKIIAVSILLFAFATVIGQASYGFASVQFLSQSKWLTRLYLCLIPITSMAGALISADAMWQIADFIVSLMTIINIIALSFYMKRQKRL